MAKQIKLILAAILLAIPLVSLADSLTQQCKPTRVIDADTQKVTSESDQKTTIRFSESMPLSWVDGNEMGMWTLDDQYVNQKNGGKNIGDKNANHLNSFRKLKI
jgi:hypothetical protein